MVLKGGTAPIFFEYRKRNNAYIIGMHYEENIGKIWALSLYLILSSN
jgi:hypothetical protein